MEAKPGTQIFYLDYYFEADDGQDDMRLLGVFSTEEKAQNMLEDLLTNPVFKGIKERFIVSQSRIGRLNWTEGYVTV